MTQSPERRAHARVNTELQLHGTPDEGGIVARMVARNLSLGGLYCISPVDFAEMTRLAVRLMLPRDGSEDVEPIEIEAVVVRGERVAPAGNGDARFELALYFTKLSAEARAKLVAYINSRTGAQAAGH